MAITPHRHEWVLVLNGPKLNQEVEPFEQELRRALGDPMLKIRRADEGSAVLMVESSNAGFNRMQEIMRHQRDLEVSGTIIRRVFTGSRPLDVVQQIPMEEDFEHSTHPLPPRLSLGPDLPIEIPCVQDDTQMSEIHKEQMRQAKLSFNCALPLGVIGILVAIWAAISWPQGPSKSAGFGIGGIMEVLMFVLLRFHSEMNRRLDDAQKEIRAQRREDRLFLKSLRIADPVKRDDVVARLLMAPPEAATPSPTKRNDNSSGARSEDNDGSRQ